MNEQEKEVIPRMCCEPGCMNYVASGYVICISHLYGVAQKATPEEQAIKRAYEKRTLKKGAK